MMTRGHSDSYSVVRNSHKIYVGNIPRDARESSVERLFQACGKVISLEFKGDFAFVEYFDEADAEKAIRENDGYRMHGRALIVERFRYRGGDPRYRRSAPNHSKRGEFRVIVTNVSERTTARDIKQWMSDENITGVALTDIYNRHGLNEGLIEFTDKESFVYTLRNLDRMHLCGNPVRLHDEKDYNRQKLVAFQRAGGYNNPKRGQFGGGGFSRFSGGNSFQSSRYDKFSGRGGFGMSRFSGGHGSGIRYTNEIPVRNAYRERERSRGRDRGRERESERGRDKDRDSDRGRDRDSDRGRERDRGRDRDSERGRNRDERERFSGAKDRREERREDRRFKEKSEEKERGKRRLSRSRSPSRSRSRGRRKERDEEDDEYHHKKRHRSRTPSRSKD